MTTEIQLDYTDLDAYQSFTRTTAIYPGNASSRKDGESAPLAALMYCALEVCDEAGEIAGKIKKLYRDDPEGFSKTAVKYEIGDVLYPLARLCDELGISLQECMELNIEKLSDRWTREALKGSGDYR